MKYLILVGLVICATATNYYDQSYEEIVHRWTKFQELYPEYIRIKENFEPTEVQIDVDCGDAPCKYFYAEVTDFSTGYETKPTVLLVGGFHGDERLGPNIITELVDTLLTHKDITPIKQYLQDKLILLMPMVNPSGYRIDTREEQQNNHSVDINRDFNYDNPRGQCFQSKGARALANLYKRYIIIGGITIHGGANVLSWPWGSRNHLIDDQEKSQESPDNKIFIELGQIMYSLALGNPSLEIPPYTLGSMTDTVYSLEGAYEDFAYGAGLDRLIFQDGKLVKQTRIVRMYQLAFMMVYRKMRELQFIWLKLHRQKIHKTLLMEIQRQIMKYTNIQSTVISLSEWPPFFYKDQDMINQNPDLKRGFGHINRNILLSLGIIDMIQPYIIYDNGGIRFGGCIEVDQVFIYEDSVLSNSVENVPGIWGNSKQIFYLNTSSQKYQHISINSVSISFTCDSAFSFQVLPEPHVQPQSFLLQSRFNSSFKAESQYNKPQLNQTFTFQLNSSKLTKVQDETLQLSSKPVEANKIHIFLLLGLMVLLGLLLSFVYYKFCQEVERYDKIEMVQVNLDMEDVS